jgi:hypothetical protein
MTQAASAIAPAVRGALSPRAVLWALLGLMLLSGLFEPLGPQSPPAPLWWVLVSAFLMSFLPFYWYRQDSEARQFRRSRLLSVAVVTLAPLGLPLYLLRSRPRGQRGAALLRLLGFILLMLLVTVIGTLPRTLLG